MPGAAGLAGGAAGAAAWSAADAVAKRLLSTSYSDTTVLAALLRAAGARRPHALAASAHVATCLALAPLASLLPARRRGAYAVAALEGELVLVWPIVREISRRTGGFDAGVAAFAEAALTRAVYATAATTAMDTFSSRRAIGR